MGVLNQGWALVHIPEVFLSHITLAPSFTTQSFTLTLLFLSLPSDLKHNPLSPLCPPPPSSPLRTLSTTIFQARVFSISPSPHRMPITQTSQPCRPLMCVRPHWWISAGVGVWVCVRVCLHAVMVVCVCVFVCLRALQACHGRVIESRRCGFLCSPSPPHPHPLVVGSECVGSRPGGAVAPWGAVK